MTHAPHKDQIIKLLESSKRGLAALEISKHIGASRSFTCIQLNNMEEAGLIKRSNKKDLRAVLWIPIDRFELPPIEREGSKKNWHFGRMTRHLNEWLLTWARKQ